MTLANGWAGHDKQLRVTDQIGLDESFTLVPVDWECFCRQRLLPLDCAAVAKPDNGGCLKNCRGRFARGVGPTQREQAPSPQGLCM